MSPTKSEDSADSIAYHAVAFIRAVLKHDPGNKSSEWVLAKFTIELRKYLDG